MSSTACLYVDLTTPGTFLFKPFLGDDSDDIAPRVNGIHVPFHKAQYASHGRVIQVHPLCQDVREDMVVAFHFATYDIVYLNFPIDYKVHPVYILNEKYVYGWWENWDE